jgi:hypothetical protein
MSTLPRKPLDAEEIFPRSEQRGNARTAIAWSSFFFAVLQSICTFFAALDGLRVTIGIGSLALSATAGAAIDRFHADWIRVPMIVLALGGSLLNLAVLYQASGLAVAPAAVACA